jgi:bacterioferritin
MAKAKDDNEAVVELLNEVLTAELTAINQYFLHAEMCRNWGLMRLYKIGKKHSIDEMKHAEQVMERILYLEGVPNVQRLNKINIGESVPEQLKSDRALEADAIVRLNDHVKTCRDAGDNGTKVLLEGILTSEEEHLDWIDAQLQLIDTVGEQNYLSQQIAPAS